MEALLIILLVVLLIGLLGGCVVIKSNDDKETNLNKKIDEVVDKIKEKF